jgi:hypothetical protein
LLSAVALIHNVGIQHIQEDDGYGAVKRLGGKIRVLIGRKLNFWLWRWVLKRAVGTESGDALGLAVFEYSKIARLEVLEKPALLVCSDYIDQDKATGGVKSWN